VTGSSSGNGCAIAVSPAAEGATVVCSDIRREAREGGYESDANTSTDELITATGGKSQYVRGRRRQLLADGEPRQHRGKRVRPTRCDGQQCRHLLRPAHQSTKTEDEYDRTMLVNFKSVWLGSKFAIRQMLPQDPVDGSRGRVVNIASIGGLVGSRPSQAIAPPRAPW